MNYELKVGPELFWAVAVTVVLAVAQVLLTFEPSEITDWRLWAVSLLGGVVRSAAGAVIGYFGARRAA